MPTETIIIPRRSGWGFLGDLTAEITCESTDPRPIKIGLAVRVLLSRRANLRRADLSYADLSGANLSGADLHRANLSGADLHRAILRGANLSEASLHRADLYRAVLSGAVLSDADLSGVDLRDAVLSGANLSGADLRGANLRGAVLHRAVLHRADLSRADLRRADLRRADLSGADLSGADLSGANLRRADAPKIPNIHQAVYAAASAPGALKMGSWHGSCGTTHCRAGWVVTLAGDAGEALEAAVGTPAAATQIYLASDPHMRRLPDFYANAADALADMKRMAEAEANRAMETDQ